MTAALTDCPTDLRLSWQAFQCAGTGCSRLVYSLSQQDASKTDELAHMQLQLGKKRRNLEVAFDQRTLELRTLSERKSRSNLVAEIVRSLIAESAC